MSSIDQLVHRFIFGYTLVCPLPNDGWKMHDNKGNPYYGMLPEYTKDLDDAWSIVDRLAEGGWNFELEFDNKTRTFGSYFTKNGYGLGHWGKSAPEAIANASLMVAKNGWVQIWKT